MFSCTVFVSVQVVLAASIVSKSGKGESFGFNVIIFEEHDGLDCFFDYFYLILYIANWKRKAINTFSSVPGSNLIFFMICCPRSPELII